MKNGFSAIELLIVVVIVGIILGVAIPNACHVVNKAKRIDELHLQWVDVCVEDMRKADLAMSHDSAIKRCELKWETEILPGLIGNRPSRTTGVPIIVHTP